MFCMRHQKILVCVNKAWMRRGGGILDRCVTRGTESREMFGWVGPVEQRHRRRSTSNKFIRRALPPRFDDINWCDLTLGFWHKIGRTLEPISIIWLFGGRVCGGGGGGIIRIYRWRAGVSGGLFALHSKGEIEREKVSRELYGRKKKGKEGDLICIQGRPNLVTLMSLPLRCGSSSSSSQPSDSWEYTQLPAGAW
jgi:hypothetical protein